MATAKFIGESPYAHNSARRHHESDYKYREYADNVALAQTSAAPRVQLAIFGLGRAGGIHLANIVANPRVKVSCDWWRAGHVTAVLTLIGAGRLHRGVRQSQVGASQAQVRGQYFQFS